MSKKFLNVRRRCQSYHLSPLRFIHTLISSDPLQYYFILPVKLVTGIFVHAQWHLKNKSERNAETEGQSNKRQGSLNNSEHLESKIILIKPDILSQLKV
jgi:hypothetical protein